MTIEAATIEDDLIKELKSMHKIYIIGEISEVTAADVINDIEDIDLESGDVLDITIFSSGGCLYSTLAIIDYLQKVKADNNLTIVTHGLGDICSGGFLLFLLGDHRTIYPMCRIYVHEHLTTDSPTTTYSKKVIYNKEEKRLNKMYTAWVAERIGSTYAKAHKLLMLDGWLSDAQIKKYNIFKE